MGRAGHSRPVGLVGQRRPTGRRARPLVGLLAHAPLLRGASPPLAVAFRTCSTNWLTTCGYASYGVFNQAVEHMEEPVPADPLSRVFAALADPTRRDMVARL